MFVELHIIQNFPPSNLNRDDLGQPKDADFGGHRRARISSQCLKRITRYAGENKAANVQPIFQRHTGVPLGSRTQLVVRALSRILHETYQHSSQESDQAAKAFAEALQGELKEDNGLLKTSVLIYFSRDELQWIAQKLHGQWQKLLVDLSPTTPLDEIAQQLSTRISQRTQVPAKDKCIAVSKLTAELNARLNDTFKESKKVASAIKKAVDAAKLNVKSLSDAELNWLAGEIKNRSASIEDSMNSESPLAPIVNEMLKVVKERTGAPDIALFGRMLADKPTTNIDAACQVAHAISTHAITGKTATDYYTAMDDEKASTELGAGFLDTAYFNSACFYRYARLDYALLKANLREQDLQGNALQNLPKKTVEAFLRASQAALPSGKKNAFAHEVRPSFMLAVLRDDKSDGWSLVNAFAKPVGTHEEDRELGFIRASVKRLVDRFDHLIAFYGDETVKAIGVALPDGEVQLGDLSERFKAAALIALPAIDGVPGAEQKQPTRLKGMDEWISAIVNHLN